MPPGTAPSVPRLIPFTVGDWLVEPKACRVSRGDTVAKLRPQLADLLVCLARRAESAHAASRRRLDRHCALRWPLLAFLGHHPDEPGARPAPVSNPVGFLVALDEELAEARA